jgi:hypothetical protein
MYNPTKSGHLFEKITHACMPRNSFSKRERKGCTKEPKLVYT